MSKKLFRRKVPYVSHVHCEIDANIKQYYHDNSQPSPSPYQQIFIYNDDGTKFKQPKHYLYSTLSEFYNNWKHNINTTNLIEHLGASIPSKAHFAHQKPRYAKKAGNVNSIYVHIILISSNNGYAFIIP